MAKKISIVEKRMWLEEYERGKSEAAIVSREHRDTRTVNKALDDARRERDARFARAELMKEALRGHQDALREELNRIVNNLGTSPGDFAPLSWHEGDNSILAVVSREKSGYGAGLASGVGRPSEAAITVRDLLRQHLKNDKLWKLLLQWERAYASHIADRIALQKKLVSLLEKKTGYRLVDKAGRPGPFLYSYTAGPALYEASLASALGFRDSSDLEEDIVVDAQAGAVKYRGSILAQAPGKEENCRNGILIAYRGLLESAELQRIVDSHEQLDSWAVRARQATDEVALLGYIPGQCRVCKRLGM